MAGSSNGRVVPAAFPPPVDSQKEFIKREVDSEDERIEVGVAIVGGGTAGLACANRLLQLLADDPEAKADALAGLLELDRDGGSVDIGSTRITFVPGGPPGRPQLHGELFL